MDIIFGLVFFNLGFAFAKPDINDNYTHSFLDNVSSILREKLNRPITTPGNFYLIKKFHLFYLFF